MMFDVCLQHVSKVSEYMPIQLAFAHKEPDWVCIHPHVAMWLCV